MKNKNLRHLISITTGTIAIYLMSTIESWFWGIRNELTEEEFAEIQQFGFSDSLIFGLFFFYVLVIQFLIVRPVFNYLNSNNELTNKHFILTAVILSLINGLILGFNFWTVQLGIKDCLESIALWSFVFSIFYVTNFMTFKKLAV